MARLNSISGPRGRPLGLAPIDSLRGRAIDAAMQLLEQKGRDGANVRAIAAQLQTGPASLYYHFANKDALLAELAAAGFRLLEATLSAAARDGSGRAPLHACGESYVNFIRAHPTLYALMYNERLLETHRTVRAAELRAFDAFAAALCAAPASLIGGRDEALALWALGRGIGALTMASGRPQDPAGREISQRIVRGLEGLMQRSIRDAPRQES